MECRVKSPLSNQRKWQYSPLPNILIKRAVYQGFELLHITRQSQNSSKVPIPCHLPKLQTSYHDLLQLVLDTQIPPLHPNQNTNPYWAQDRSLERLSTKIEKRIYLLLSPIDKNNSVFLLPLGTSYVRKQSSERCRPAIHTQRPCITWFQSWVTSKGKYNATIGIL